MPWHMQDLGHAGLAYDANDSSVEICEVQGLNCYLTCK